MLKETLDIGLLSSHARSSHPLRGRPSPHTRFAGTRVPIAMIIALCVPLLPVPGVGRAVAQGRGAINRALNSRTINGHVVADRFLEVWSAQGSERDSVYVNGLPITGRRAEVSLSDGKTYDTQWFERARYEAHPGNQPPYDVLLGLLGVALTGGRGSLDPAT